MTRPTAAPEPWEELAWWWRGSGPVARSLRILDELEVLARASGQSSRLRAVVKVSQLTPPPALARDRSGKPIVRLPGDTFHVTSHRELHALAQEALRRLASQEEEAGVCDEA